MSDGLTDPCRVDQPDATLATAFADLWIRVIAAGGAVAFATGDPESDISDAAERVIDNVRAGAEHAFTVHRNTELAGVVFLAPGSGRHTAHRGSVLRLMVDPDLQGRGLGGRLLTAAVTEAGEIGLERLFLSCRSGHGLEAFYTRNGWTECGRWPASMRVVPGDDRDEIWFTRTVS